LQTNLKKLNVQPIQQIEEVNMFKSDGNVIHFSAPKGKFKESKDGLIARARTPVLLQDVGPSNSSQAHAVIIRRCTTQPLSDFRITASKY